MSDYMVQLVIVLLMHTMDFYVVKNFSGRYLVGLRWWSVISADGLSNTFRFEKTNVLSSLLFKVASRKSDEGRQSYFLVFSSAEYGYLVDFARIQSISGSSS